MLKCPKCEQLCVSESKDKLRLIAKYGEKDSRGNLKVPKGIPIETLHAHLEREHDFNTESANAMARHHKEKELAKHPKHVKEVKLDAFGLEAPEIHVPSGHVGKWEVYRGPKKEKEDVKDI